MRQKRRNSEGHAVEHDSRNYGEDESSSGCSFHIRASMDHSQPQARFLEHRQREDRHGREGDQAEGRGRQETGKNCRNDEGDDLAAAEAQGEPGGAADELAV